MTRDTAAAISCGHCGIELESGARFCGGCGKPVAPQVVLSLDATLVAPPPPEALRPPTASGREQVAAPPLPGRLERKSEALGSRDNLIGRTLNRRYLVGEKIGEGGFGAVFRGKQLATGRDVALKILHPHNVSDATIVARFRREAEACSRLRSPHTVTTYDFDETEDGVLYLAMELLRGRSLHHLQKAEGVLSPTRTLRILDQVAEALAEAHEHGVIHRDMKPENVFIEKQADQDYVKVLDFGIAKIISDDRPQKALTAVGQTLGTIEFMSPEQLRGVALDGRADIYALGIMAYEMLTGQLPFSAAKSATQIINFHMNQPPPAPSQLRPDLDIPPAVDRIVMKMVAKSRDDRFRDARDLRASVAKALRTDDAGASGGGDRSEKYRIAAIVTAAFMTAATVIYLLVR